MTAVAKRPVYLSFFMFTANLEPGDESLARRWTGHMKAMRALGYDGFDLPIAPGAGDDHAAEFKSYETLKRAIDVAGLGDMGITTNVGATRRFDPTSPYADQRAEALAYLKSRVDITCLLGGRSVMAGPIIYPYAQFPTTDAGDPIWSDALQEFLAARYERARPVLTELGEYAQHKGVKLAIEPVDHWETPGPNMVSEVVDFVQLIPDETVGVTIDSAHVALGSTGRTAYRDDVRRALAGRRLHYVHVSALDRGRLVDSWLPWSDFMPPILAGYRGPYLIEVFNAVGPFPGLLRLSRRKFWTPDVDPPVQGQPNAYEVAAEGLHVLREQFARFDNQVAGDDCDGV